MTSQEPRTAACYHATLVTFRDQDGVPRIWACADCRLRFEPGRAEAANGSALDVERLARVAADVGIDFWTPTGNEDARDGMVEMTFDYDGWAAALLARLTGSPDPKP